MSFYHKDEHGQIQRATFDNEQVKRIFHGSFHKVREKKARSAFRCSDSRWNIEIFLKVSLTAALHNMFSHRHDSAAASSEVLQLPEISYTLHCRVRAPHRPRQTDFWKVPMNRCSSSECKTAPTVSWTEGGSDLHPADVTQWSINELESGWPGFDFHTEVESGMAILLIYHLKLESFISGFSFNHHLTMWAADTIYL